MRRLLVGLAVFVGLTFPAMAGPGFRVNLNFGPPPVYVVPPEYPPPVYAYPPPYVYPYPGYGPTVWGGYYGHWHGRGWRHRR